MQGNLYDKPCSEESLEAKYLISNTEEYAKRLERFDKLGEEKRHAPLVKMEMKTILRGINVGLWIIHINAKTGEGELYTDETMRKLLGIDDSITPKECFKHWQKNIHKKCYSDVDKMIDDMANSKNVTQVEYLWHHPQKGILNVRCSGRCVEENDEIMVFEGFHRIIDNI